MTKQTKDLNDKIKSFLDKTIWMWLPFFILFPLLRLTKDRIRKLLGRR